MRQLLGIRPHSGGGAGLRRQHVGVTQLVDDLIRDTDHVEVHEAAARVALDDVDNASKERVLAVTSDDQRIETTREGSSTVRSGPVTSADTAANGASFQLNSSSATRGNEQTLHGERPSPNGHLDLDDRHGRSDRGR
jgi:hypothetical protein